MILKTKGKQRKHRELEKKNWIGPTRMSNEHSFAELDVAETDELEENDLGELG